MDSGTGEAAWQEMTGGLAGLVAAYERTQAGHDVTILEAQMRPGGSVIY